MNRAVQELSRNRSRSARLLVGAAEAASFCLGPSPAEAGGGWEGVSTVRNDPEDTPPQPSPAFAGEGARTRGFRRSYKSCDYVRHLRIAACDRPPASWPH